MLEEASLALQLERPVQSRPENFPIDPVVDFILNVEEGEGERERERETERNNKSVSDGVLR